MSDLADLYAYIALESAESVATDYVIQLDQTLALLRQMPLMGSPRPMLGAGIRALIHRNHVVYYVQQARAVVILRVLHGARDVRAIAGEGGFSIQ